MKRLGHMLWMLLAFSCTTTDMEPTLSVARPDGDTPSVKYLSPKEAGNIATAFMASLDGDGERSRGDKTRKVSEVSLLNSKTITRSAETDTTFYVVDFEEGGYSLIAADRELDNNVYVYSPDGEFSSDDNPVLDIYLENAIATMPDAPRRGEIGNMAKMSRANVPNDKDLPITGEEYINGVLCTYIYKASHTIKQPLIWTLWHQHAPYNIYCPVEKNQHTLVGCVAVAIGQICAYHRWPQQVDGYTYNWDDMLLYNSHSNETMIGLNDIALFLRKVGDIVDMDYGTDSSSATTKNILSGLKKLGYTSAILTDYSTFKCAYELGCDRPVLMIGTNSKGEGHAWVVDGCDNMTNWVEYYRKDTGELYASYSGAGYTYLHFVSGWKGYNDTYFLCSTAGINDGNNYPKFSVFGYDKDNKIITGIKR